ncbi:TetR/AcrR family transcriptional regulator [Pseudonocardia pini]|uniref:TetR/AcrR family transcriptional regulator n=1 Tax=Pseudonocardia pini TaxID=2758030 RepID=UPI0015F09662|nr:TetR/AcrR family transcriptional regulator [Pseudonocardia pini]
MTELRSDGGGRASSTPDSGRARTILTVAAKLFRERGYSGTTVRDLASEAGISSGSVFHHFKTKEEVLLRVVEEGLAESMARIDAAVVAGMDPRETLRAMIRAHVGTLLEGSPAAMSVLFYERWSLSPESLSRLIGMRDQYEHEWDVALAALGGDYLNRSHRRLARLLLFGAMNWTAQWYSPSGEFSLDEISAALADRYLG